MCTNNLSSPYNLITLIASRVSATGTAYCSIVRLCLPPALDPVGPAVAAAADADADAAAAEVVAVAAFSSTSSNAAAGNVAVANFPADDDAVAAGALGGAVAGDAAVAADAAASAASASSFGHFAFASRAVGVGFLPFAAPSAAQDSFEKDRRWEDRLFYHAEEISAEYLLQVGQSLAAEQMAPELY